MPLKRTVKKKAIHHLDEDIAGYKKQRKDLVKEIKEDQDLKKALRSKNATCKRKKS